MVVERQVLTGTPKSKKSKRTLPMPTEVVDVLKAARKRQIEDRLVAGSQYRGGEYVASNQLGEPLHPDAVTSRWEKLLKDLGIPAVRLHDARHSCATLMHRMHLRGVPIAVIAAWLGHASAAFHDGDLRAQPGRRAGGRGGQFQSSCTTRDTETGAT